MLDRMPADPRVLHFNDAAGVGLALVRAAERQGLHWDLLPQSRVRPSLPAARLRGLGRVRYVPFLARRAVALGRADVVHVHSANNVRLLRERGMPRRPYLLHLHGTDIRERWPDPAHRAEIQAAVDGAFAVYYTTPDLAENALRARPDAVHMPAFVEAGTLPAWAPGPRRRVVYVSRWSAVKGAPEVLALARRLAELLPSDVEQVGLDWGPDAEEARRAGVRLVPRLAHAEYLELLASAHVCVGQATSVLGVSELEAMAVGPPLASVGEHLSAPATGAPPVLEGAVDDVAERVVAALADPRATAAALGSRRWVLTHHVADPYVPTLRAAYRAAARG